MADKRDREQDTEAQRPFLPAESSENVSLGLEGIEMKGAMMEDEQPRRRTWATWARPGIELLMAAVIILLLLRPLRAEKKDLLPSPVPDFPKKVVVFNPQEQYLHDGMFANETETLRTLHNWIPLSADGRGYVKIKDAKKYGMGKAYDFKVNQTHTEPAYMLSVFHQLHCLSYLAVAFQKAFTDTMPDNEVAFHSIHCFDYIRQAILCNADTSLEGETGHPGWGGVHQCKDIDAIRDWANHNDLFKYRGLMPTESVL